MSDDFEWDDFDFDEEDEDDFIEEELADRHSTRSSGILADLFGSTTIRRSPKKRNFSRSRHLETDEDYD